jgi:hypothetical protein
MFIIKLNRKLAPNQMLHDTLVNLSYYKVRFYALYVNDIEIIVVDIETHEGGLRLAETAFQMDSRYKQEGDPTCPICKGKEKAFCGHLTFIPR